MKLPRSISAQSSLNSTVDGLSGFLLALPFGLPNSPIYPIAMLVFLINLPRLRLRNYFELSYLVTLLILTSYFIFRSALTDEIYSQSLEKFITNSMFLIILTYGLCVRDYKCFLSSYAYGTAAMSAVVLLMFFWIRPFDMGPAMFVSAHGRLWGNGFLPDFPNLLGVGLGIGFLLNALIFRRPLLALLNLAAILATTSRSAILVFLIYGLYVILRNREFRTQFWISIVTASSIMVVVYLYLNAPVFLVDRLLKISDRVDLFRNFVVIILDNLFFGAGSVSADDLHDRFVSFHNTYLKILLRFGLFGFIPFLFLIIPPKVLTNPLNPLLTVYYYLLMIALVQDSLAHAHLMMIISVIIFGSEQVNLGPSYHDQQSSVQIIPDSQQRQRAPNPAHG